MTTSLGARPPVATVAPTAAAAPVNSGALLPLAGVPYVTGTESQRETGEPDAPEQGDPQMMQGFTVCFAMDHLDGDDHTIVRTGAGGHPPQPRQRCGERRRGLRVEIESAVDEGTTVTICS